MSDSLIERVSGPSAAATPVLVGGSVPVTGVRTAEQPLTASAALPAAGAYEAVPAQGSMVAIPVTARRATIRVKYTRGAAGGQAAHKIYVSGGTNPMQAMAPDGTFAGIYGAPSTSASAIYYAISIDLIGGETGISQAGAEVGVTGTPGTVETTVTFG